MILINSYRTSTKTIFKNQTNCQKYFFIIGNKRFASERINIKDYLLNSGSLRIKHKKYRTASKILTKAEQNRLSPDERANYWRNKNKVEEIKEVGILIQKIPSFTSYVPIDAVKVTRKIASFGGKGGRRYKVMKRPIRGNAVVPLSFKRTTPLVSDCAVKMRETRVFRLKHIKRIMLLIARRKKYIHWRFVGSYPTKPRTRLGQHARMGSGHGRFVGWTAIKRSGEVVAEFKLTHGDINSEQRIKNAIRAIPGRPVVVYQNSISAYARRLAFWKWGGDFSPVKKITSGRSKNLYARACRYMSLSKYIEGDYYDLLKRHFFDRVVTRFTRPAYGVQLPTFRYKKQWDIRILTNDKKALKKKAKKNASKIASTV